MGLGVCAQQDRRHAGSALLVPRRSLCGGGCDHGGAGAGLAPALSPPGPRLAGLCAVGHPRQRCVPGFHVHGIVARALVGGGRDRGQHQSADPRCRCAVAAAGNAHAQQGDGDASWFGGVLAIVLARGHSGSAALPDVALAVVGVVSSVASTVLFKRVRGDGISLQSMRSDCSPHPPCSCRLRCS